MWPPPAGWVSVLRMHEAALLSAQVASIVDLSNFRFLQERLGLAEEDVSATWKAGAFEFSRVYTLLV
jgi:hypothetical protein